MGNTRVLGVALVAVSNRFAFFDSKDGVAILALGLQQLNDAIVGSNRIRG